MGYQIVPLEQGTRRGRKRGRVADAIGPAVVGADPHGPAPRQRRRPAKVTTSDEDIAS
jgi:hypothetical protein